VSESKSQKFERVDVENLNIVDKDGNIKMTLFSRDSIPAAIIDGKDILPGHRSDWPISGIMFYNGEGDECGGLIFGSERDENGSYSSFASLTFDQYKQDEVVQITYNNENGALNYGFSVADRSKTPLPILIDKMQEIKGSNKDDKTKEKEIAELWDGNTRRAFMGRNEKNEVTVQLMDSKGKQRIRMLVDENDIPRIEFLDGKGDVIYKIPPEI
jgi:hypothetical protein